MEIPLQVGNTAQPTDAHGRNKWAWHVFLKAGEFAPLVSKVEYKLHETFLEPRVTVDKPTDQGAFESSEHVGWGTFDVGVTVHWDPAKVASPRTTGLVHGLDFEQAESAQAVVVRLVPQPEAEPEAQVPWPSDVEMAGPEAGAEPEPEQEAGPASREELLATLRDILPLDPETDPLSFHGRLGSPEWAAPKAVWVSDQKPRDGSAPWLTATEYAEAPDVLAAKVALLAQLLRRSRHTVAYTGAGISVAAGIGMAAVGSSAGKAASSKAAAPTHTHHALAALSGAGLLHGWVQQNHDGLPQKAGFPQEKINEVHGSWFDPSNPVVKYSGSLRTDLFEGMEAEADGADLALVLGTSLTGLNADQVASKPARRSARGKALGSVIISPQRTSHDGACTLRIFAKADDVFRALAEPLALKVRRSPPRWPAPAPVEVPYDRDGRRSSTEVSVLDLRVGKSVRVSAHNNIKGAQQPAYKDVTALTPGRVVAVTEESVRIDFAGATMTLGLWWIDVAKRGAVEYLPIYNADGAGKPSGRARPR